MQKLILLLALGTVLASCQGETQQADVAEPVKKDVNEGVVPDSILMPMAEADHQIQRYHNRVNLGDGDTTIKTAFMLDAVSLKNYLVANPDVVMLDIYMAEKIAASGQQEINLIYIGAIQDSSGKYVERAYTKSADDTAKYMLNHGIPCPHCDRERLFAPPVHH